MALPIKELDSTAIVVRGRFNPPIFQPAWLAQHDLIRQAEAESAEGLLVHREICQYKADWLALQVTTDRFVASTEDGGKFGPLMDLVVGIFHILEHTPAHGLGINRDQHYDLVSEDAWSSLESAIVGTEMWDIGSSRPRLSSVRVVWDAGAIPAKAFSLKVDKSPRLPCGVSFDANTHFEVEQTNGLAHLMTMLKTHWNPALAHSEDVAERILTRAMGACDE